ncbi:MAG: glycerophosphodiester phosphodiesterase [Planctomycetota bacterium]
MRSFLGFLLILIPMTQRHLIAAEPLIVGHRGASADAPENTLAAFRLAWDQGADGIEGDFHLTADNKIVCIHDTDTERISNKKLVVKDVTLEQLRGLDAGSWKSKDFSGESIPTFKEVFATVPNGKTFVIELKVGPEIVPILKSELEQIDPGERQLLIISFNVDTIAACKASMPQLKCHWLTSFKRTATLRYQPNPKSIIATMKKCQADGVGMKGETKVINEAFLDQLRQAGIDEFHVWTVDAPSVAKRFKQLGAFGITTNVPATIRNTLAQ